MVIQVEAMGNEWCLQEMIRRIGDDTEIKIMWKKPLAILSMISTLWNCRISKMKRFMLICEHFRGYMPGANLIRQMPLALITTTWSKINMGFALTLNAFGLYFISVNLLPVTKSIENYFHSRKKNQWGNRGNKDYLRAWVFQFFCRVIPECSWQLCLLISQQKNLESIRNVQACKISLALQNFKLETEKSSSSSRTSNGHVIVESAYSKL